MRSQYRSDIPWSAERPKVLVVCCSDGRWHAQMVDFVQSEICDRPDMYAVPGGPVAVDPWASSFEEARVLQSALELFVAYHDLHEVWLVAHQGCAYYRQRHPNSSDEELRQRQTEDLERARKILRERYPTLLVRLVFAGRQDDRVLFTPIDMQQPVERRVEPPGQRTAKRSNTSE